MTLCGRTPCRNEGPLEWVFDNGSASHQTVELRDNPEKV